MKINKNSLLIVILLVTTTICVHAQNTFPSSGNVGIGTTSPTYLLDVNGVTHITGEIDASSGIRVLGAVGDNLENGSPWYGLGVSTSLPNCVQLVGYYGLNLRTVYG